MSTEHSTRPAERSEAEIEILVQKFESCELSLAEFSHAEHLTVALWYLSKLTEAEAIERMRGGLQRFIKRHGRMGYHETITLFWLKIVRRFLEERGASRPLADLTRELVETRGPSRLIYDYYSKDLLSSAEARARWVEPDVQPLA